MLQFYPSSDDQIELITSIAQKAGFGGGVVVDYPNSKKARKVFLCLFVGGGGGAQSRELPKGLDGEGIEEGEAAARFEKRRERERKRDKSGKRKAVKGGKDWILKKKEVCPTLVPFQLDIHSSSALQTEREGRCPARLKVYRSETAHHILTCTLYLYLHSYIITHYITQMRQQQER